MRLYHHVHNYEQARACLMAQGLWLRDPEERTVVVMRNGWHEVPETRDLTSEERVIDIAMRHVPVFSGVLA